jgi:hypothetical protein
MGIFFQLLNWPYYSVQYWTCEHVYISDFKIYYIPSVILLYWPYYSVQYCTRNCKHEYTYVRISRLIIFLQLFYYFGHIILFSIELGNMSMFQDHEVCYSSAIIAFHILLNAILILLARVYLKFLNIITLQKLIMNGNLSIITWCIWFIIH